MAEFSRKPPALFATVWSSPGAVILYSCFWRLFPPVRTVEAWYYLPTAGACPHNIHSLLGCRHWETARRVPPTLDVVWFRSSSNYRGVHDGRLKYHISNVQEATKYDGFSGRKTVRTVLLFGVCVSEWRVYTIRNDGSACAVRYITLNTARTCYQLSHSFLPIVSCRCCAK